MKRLGVIASCIAVLAHATTAEALTFDGRGVATLGADATVSESFEGGVLTEAQLAVAIAFDGDDPVTGEGALHGTGFVRIGVTGSDEPFEADLALPPSDASYRFALWVRHGRVWARAVLEHSTARETEVAYLFPSGRVTSDGWAELVSNPVSVAGSELARAFLRLEGSEIDVDAIEVSPGGVFDGGSACSGAFDPVCGSESVCLSGRCRQGDRYVPPLPAAEHRDSIAEHLAGRVTWLFGGRLTRLRNLPAARVELDAMKSASTAWQFWGSFARAVRRLGDWHTSASSAISIHRSPRVLPVCFIEGRADLTFATWPSDAARADVLVSHGFESSPRLRRGDRLVAVDGRHPLEWARSLVQHDWGYHPADDPDVDAEFAEALRGTIPTFARTFTVIHCDAATGTCDAVPTTYDVSDIAVGGQGPACDNRPDYHLRNPPSSFGGSVTDSHFLPFQPWLDELVDSAPGEKLLGMTWDNLYGPALTPFLLRANDRFRAEARGVILDHRAGNGGTIDAPQALTQLVRSPLALSVGPGFMIEAGSDGPATPEEGRAEFERLTKFPGLTYEVGSDDPALDLPVALIIHRDGSASDWLPHGLKGAPNVRIFGPHETAGAFSSFYQFSYWSRFDFQLASGDTITRDGETLIGHGIRPDVIVEHTQSSLLGGKDLPYEAALAWVRENLRP